MPNLEDVFRLSGIPTHTFVKPDRYNEIMVSMRTPGRCMVLEGPSGIGKTTTVTKVLAELGIERELLQLKSRVAKDVELIRALPEMGDIGTVIVDDFHVLDAEIKARLSDFMKVLADSEDQKSKLVLIGINKAGQQLIDHAHDVGLRIDVFRLEVNPENKVQDVITLGENVLNIRIERKEDIARKAQGSFQIAQLLCHKLCTLNDLTATCAELRNINLPIEVVVEDVMADLSRQFKETAITFARGSKLRREGRAPYLHILRWLAESNDWSLDLRLILNQHPEHRASIGQVLEKGHLLALLQDGEKRLRFEPYFHFEAATAVLSVEDPKLIFFLKNLIWRGFTREVGFTAEYFRGRYDFALSFSGTDRGIARRLADIIANREVSIFYDENEQHRILAANVEEYLAPIYRSEARYVVPLLGADYPKRIWTKFESDNFKDRFGSNAVIPIRFSSVQTGYFSDDQKYGSLTIDVDGDIETQLQSIAEILCDRLIEDRQAGAAEVAEEDALQIADA